MYEVGLSKKEAYKAIGEKSILRNKDYKPKNSPDIDILSIKYDVNPLRTYHNMQVWCGRLMANIRLIDNEIDELFCQIIEYNDGIFASKKILKKTLNKLFSLKESVRNIEIDVEEFVSVCSTTEHTLESNFSSSTLQLLNQLNSSYDMTYNLVIYKLKSISNSRVTYANILISLIALATSLFALFNG